MEQVKLNAPTSWSKTGVKRENFTPTEKHIAKIGLAITVPVAVRHALHLAFPNAREIAAAFASVGMLLLLLVAACVLCKPTKTAADSVKNAARFGMRFIERQRKSCKPAFANAAVRHGRVSGRTRVRSRAYRSHRSHTASTGTSNDNSGNSGDSAPPGDPSKPFQRVTTSALPTYNATEHDALSPWKRRSHGLVVNRVFSSLSHVFDMTWRGV